MAENSKDPEHDPNGDLTEVQNELGDMRACDCGGVHLAMGPLTLHFTADDIDPLFELVAAAKDMADAKKREETRKASKKRRAGKPKNQGLLH